ncbi:hypothetical protein TNCV_2784961 [Trichonephila clavipes]|nr:hypothetical protein TNCV_2784961 [Trichonephila clavipes]
MFEEEYHKFWFPKQNLILYPALWVIVHKLLTTLLFSNLVERGFSAVKTSSHRKRVQLKTSAGEQHVSNNNKQEVTNRKKDETSHVRTPKQGRCKKCGLKRDRKAEISEDFQGRQCQEYIKNTWLVDNKKTSDRANCKGQLALTMCGERLLRLSVRRQQSKWIVQHSLHRMSFGSRRLTRVPLFNALQRASRLVWARQPTE